MGKRHRSLAVSYDGADISITQHAIRRFRVRVEAGSDREICSRVRVLLVRSSRMYSAKPGTRVYLSNDRCVFVLTHSGVIVTVYGKFQHHSHLFQSKKDASRFRKQQKKRRRESYPNAKKPRSHPDESDGRRAVPDGE